MKILIAGDGKVGASLTRELTAAGYDITLIDSKQNVLDSSIELIPECKIVMMNHDYYLVKDTVEEIIKKIADYNAKVQDIHRQITVIDKRN